VLPVADLGRAKQPGWEARDELPMRPDVDNPRVREQRTRHIRRKEQDADEATAARVEREQYLAMVERIKLISRSSVPSDATVLVLSKGDDQLLDLDCHEAWHFPFSPDGKYIGYHPPDAEWAIEQLELARARGADYLLMPATSLWWMDHYPAFAQHVNKEYAQIVEDESCAVFALGRFPALYGRDREEVVRSHQREVTQLVREPGAVPSPELFVSGS
jgi:hypothetical protein